MCTTSAFQKEHMILKSRRPLISESSDGGFKLIWENNKYYLKNILKICYFKYYFKNSI